MSDPFVAGEGGNVADPQANVAGQPAQNQVPPDQNVPLNVQGQVPAQGAAPGNVQGQMPAQGEPPVAPLNEDPTSMRARILQLESRLNNLGVNTGGAVGQLAGAVQQTHNVALARPANVRIPQPQRFKGNREGPRVLEWIHQATTYLKAAGIDNSETGVWHISNFLEGDAAIWWRHYCSRIGRDAQMPLNWAALAQLLADQFQTFNHDTDVRDQFSALRQTGTVTAYIAKFRSVIVELPNMPPEDQIYQFLKGLKPEIQARTRTHKPKTLVEAMDIADEADRAHYHAFRGPTSSSRSSGYSRSAASGPSPMHIGTLKPRNTDQGWDETNATGFDAKYNEGTGGYNAVLAPHELQRLRQEGRCFNCRKTGHVANKCPLKQRRKQKAPTRRQAARRKASN